MRANFVLTLLTTVSAQNYLFCQKITDQPLTSNFKVIKKVDHYDDGTISGLRYYQPIKRKPSAEELFLNGTETNFNFVDSTIYEERPIGEWTRYMRNGSIESKTRYDIKGYLMNDTYEYAYNKLVYIKRERRNAYPTKYILGNTDSVEINKVSFNIVERANQPFEICTNIKNISTKDIEVKLLSNHDLKITSSNISVKKGDSADVKINLVIPKGQAVAQIKLATSEWQFGLELMSYGYHITTSDMLNTKRQVLPTKFIYVRTGDEYQIEIAGPYAKTLRYVPISREKNEIELSPGMYKFTIVGRSGRNTKEVEIE